MAVGVVTYINPTASGTVPPTAVQMLPLSRVVATAAFGDSDTTCTITHNMNIPLASSPTQHGQNSGSPMVIITQIFAASPTGTAPVSITFTRGTNTIALTKGSLTGSAGTWEVQIERYEPLL